MSRVPCLSMPPHAGEAHAVSSWWQVLVLARVSRHHGVGVSVPENRRESSCSCPSRPLLVAGAPAPPSHPPVAQLSLSGCS